MAYPCVIGTGPQPGGVVCKSISEQIKEFVGAIEDNKIPVKNLWLDFEPTSSPCNAFNQDVAKNRALANDWVAAVNKTKYKWGIYANP